MEELAWSFKVMYQGACPKKDKRGGSMDAQKGRRFRPGWLWGITGDLEWFASEFQFPFPGNNYICPYCLADQKLKDSTRPFNDFRPSAAWRASALTPAKLQEEYGAHPLLKLPTANALAVKLDVLHALDLGVAAYLHGSVLISVMNQLGGRTRILIEVYGLF